jgi:hypothetical protein
VRIIILTRSRVGKTDTDGLEEYAESQVCVFLKQNASLKVVFRWTRSSVVRVLIPSGSGCQSRVELRFASIEMRRLLAVVA